MNPEDEKDLGYWHGRFLELLEEAKSYGVTGVFMLHEANPLTDCEAARGHWNGGKYQTLGLLETCRESINGRVAPLPEDSE